MRRALATTAALQGNPSDATLSIPHNDSWLFEDNVDATHPANLRYIISANVQRVVSARLSIFLAPYRTYNSLSLTATGNESATHKHGSASHAHTLAIQAAIFTNSVGNATGGTPGQLATAGGMTDTTSIQNTTPGSTGTEDAVHAHSVSGTAVLGVTEGATAAGVSVSFDGVDATAALGGPFNADVIELNVLPFLAISKGIKHTIAMQPTGLGRIEAHLRLGVYVAAGSQF